LEKSWKMRTCHRPRLTQLNTRGWFDCWALLVWTDWSFIPETVFWFWDSVAPRIHVSLSNCWPWKLCNYEFFFFLNTLPVILADVEVLLRRSIAHVDFLTTTKNAVELINNGSTRRQLPAWMQTPTSALATQRCLDRIIAANPAYARTLYITLARTTHDLLFTSLLMSTQVLPDPPILNLNPRLARLQTQRGRQRSKTAAQCPFHTSSNCLRIHGVPPG
jgi:hypothetical protein